VSIARAFVHHPRIVLLDEPYTGLDAVGATALSTALLELKATGAALILVTHNIDEGLALATRVAVMHQGRFARVDSRDTVDAARFAGEYRALVGADA
jgi:ABC-type multidrug transport system ATPase subunit